MLKIILAIMGIIVTSVAKEYFIWSGIYFDYRIPATYLNMFFGFLFLCFLVDYFIKNKKIHSVIRVLIVIYFIVSVIMYTLKIFEL